MIRMSGFSRRLLPAVAVLLFLAGCAGFQFVDASLLPFKQCSKSFTETVATLVLGVTESSLTFIQKVLQEGLQWYQVVGGEDVPTGLRKVGEIKKYPGPPLNEMLEEYSTQFVVVSEVPSGQSGEKVVWLKRIDTILDTRPYQPLREEHRYRRFIVRNSPRGYCVTSVRLHPGDKTWISHSEFQALTVETSSAKPAQLGRLFPCGDFFKKLFFCYY